MDATDKAARFEHRRQRLVELLQALEPTPRAWFAAAIQRSPDYIARLLLAPDSPHRKNIGDAIMAAATAAIGLDHGWFDMPLGSAIPQGISLDDKGRVHGRRQSADRPKVLGPTAESVTDFTPVLDAVDQALFDALPAQQQQDIAEMAAHLVKAFTRYNAPPNGGKGAWKDRRGQIERQAAAGPRIQQPTERKRGSR